MKKERQNSWVHGHGQQGGDCGGAGVQVEVEEGYRGDEW